MGDNWRGAALARAQDLAVSCLIMCWDWETRKQVAPGNYPARCFDPAAPFDRPMEQPRTGSFPGAACFAPVSVKQVIEQISLGQWIRAKAAPLQSR